MIAESYDLISDSPSKRIYEAVKQIPYGCVATYAHGLSFYVETTNHKLLIDFGPSDETLKNAKRLTVLILRTFQFPILYVELIFRLSSFFLFLSF